VGLWQLRSVSELGYTPFAPTKCPALARPSGVIVSKESHRKRQNKPERLPLRWALIIFVGLLAGVAVSTARQPALTISTVLVAALAMDQLLP
jgi:hypothetical protein